MTAIRPGRSRYVPRRARRSRRRRNLRRAGFVAFFAVVLGLLGAVAAFAIGYAITPVPDPNRLVTSNTTVVYYADGKTVLGTFAARNRISVPLDRIPKHVQDAVLAAENRTFWTDPGISPTGILRALWNDVRGESTQGGSTITQQYVKNYYLSPEQTWSRKVKELFITLKIQQRLPKAEILQNYLNTIYFGRGAYGIQTAAHSYFGIDVDDLTVEQAAVLAAVAKAPGRYDPAAGPDNQEHLANRFRYVMSGLVEMGVLSREQAAKAKLPKVLPVAPDEQYAGPQGYLLVETKRALERLGYSERRIESGGLRVTTTFDVQAQRAAEQAVARGFPDRDVKGVHAGLAAVRPSTGEVVAMYGGRDYLARQFDDAVQARIEPGSTFKVFALAAALERGLSLQTPLSGHDGFRLPGGKLVHNEFNRDYGSSVTLLQAVEQSINTAFVDLTVNKIGPPRVLDAAVRAGVPRDSPGLAPVPLVALGNASVSPVNMANAYATFAAGGVRSRWHVVDEVTTRTGSVLHESEPDRSRAFSADVTADVTAALRGVVEHGTGTAARKLGRPAAGKTGTHEDRTAWFVGYTPQLATAVGFYREDRHGRRQSLDGVGGMSTFTGGGYPAAIWTAFMRGALRGEPVEGFPPAAHIGQIAETATPTPTPTAPGTPTATPSPTSPSATPVPTTATTSPATPDPATTSPAPAPSTSSAPTPTVPTTVPGTPATHRPPGPPAPRQAPTATTTEPAIAEPLAGPAEPLAGPAEPLAAERER